MHAGRNSIESVPLKRGSDHIDDLKFLPESLRSLSIFIESTEIDLAAIAKRCPQLRTF